MTLAIRFETQHDDVYTTEATHYRYKDLNAVSASQTFYSPLSFLKKIITIKLFHN